MPKKLVVKITTKNCTTCPFLDGKYCGLVDAINRSEQLPDHVNPYVYKSAREGRRAAHCPLVEYDVQISTQPTVPELIEVPLGNGRFMNVESKLKSKG